MKNKKVLPLLLLTLTLSSCGEPTSVNFALDEISGKVEFHTATQLTKFINNPGVVQDTMLTYLDGLNFREDYSKPNAVELKFTATADGKFSDNFVVEVGEDSTLSDSYKIYTKENIAYFKNPKINTTYYWRVSYKEFQSDISSFSTNETAIRNIDIDGVKNVRDLGGFGFIKQGLLYRGGAFEEANSRTGEVTVGITEDGIKTIKEQLKIKTEVDLRKNVDSNENCGTTASRIDGVNYVALPMYYGGENVLTYKNDNYDDPSRVKDFINLLADRNNYPVYFHCVHGKDRTGGLAYVVEALLGSSEESLYRDYLFSNFANSSYGMKPSGIDGNFGKTLHEYLKEDTSLTLAERTYQYLHDELGLSEQTLDTVIDILKA